MSGPKTAYFDRRMVNRERLIWTVATRRQLERWEPLVAESVRRRNDDRQLDNSDIWAAQIEHHFALIAGRHLLQALELDPATKVRIDPTLRAELKEGRDLHEHWEDNLSVFNVKPRVEQPPRKSGRDFAARNPDQSPYWWLGWSNKTGAKLLPHVSAPELHAVLDAVEDEVLADDSELAGFVPARQPSPWVCENGEWWPA
jgi:hypothetical protein